MASCLFLLRSAVLVSAAATLGVRGLLVTDLERHAGESQPCLLDREQAAEDLADGHFEMVAADNDLLLQPEYNAFQPTDNGSLHDDIKDPDDPHATDESTDLDDAMQKATAQGNVDVGADESKQWVEAMLSIPLSEETGKMYNGNCDDEDDPLDAAKMTAESREKWISGDGSWIPDDDWQKHASDEWFRLSGNFTIELKTKKIRVLGNKVIDLARDIFNVRNLAIHENEYLKNILQMGTDQAVHDKHAEAVRDKHAVDSGDSASDYKQLLSDMKQTAVKYKESIAEYDALGQKVFLQQQALLKDAEFNSMNADESARQAASALTLALANARHLGYKAIEIPGTDPDEAKEAFDGIQKLKDEKKDTFVAAIRAHKDYFMLGHPIDEMEKLSKEIDLGGTEMSNCNSMGMAQYLTGVGDPVEKAVTENASSKILTASERHEYANRVKCKSIKSGKDVTSMMRIHDVANARKNESENLALQWTLLQDQMKAFKAAPMKQQMQDIKFDFEKLARRYSESASAAIKRYLELKARIMVIGKKVLDTFRQALAESEEWMWSRFDVAQRMVRNLNQHAHTPDVQYSGIDNIQRHPAVLVVEYAEDTERVAQFAKKAWMAFKGDANNFAQVFKQALQQAEGAADSACPKPTDKKEQTLEADVTKLFK